MKHILLIEDNKDHAELITKSLSSGLGKVKVHFADRAERAFEVLKKQRFDLILSDYYLPDSQGEAHIRQLVKSFPETPIIIITGQGDEKTAARSIKAGADDYIVKTREALQALPKILNRAFAKHQASLKKKQSGIKKELRNQKLVLKKVLEEIHVLEKKLKQLPASAAKSQTSRTRHHTLVDSLVKRVDLLKGYVQKMFFSGD
jgi:DNA-binding NtrC family response regulator